MKSAKLRNVACSATTGDSSIHFVCRIAVCVYYVYVHARCAHRYRIVTYICVLIVDLVSTIRPEEGGIEGRVSHACANSVCHRIFSYRKSNENKNTSHTKKAAPCLMTPRRQKHIQK